MATVAEQLQLVREALMDEIEDNSYKKDPVSIGKQQRKVGGIFDALALAATLHSDRMERIAVALEDIAKSLKPVPTPVVP